MLSHEAGHTAPSLRHPLAPCYRPPVPRRAAVLILALAPACGPAAKALPDLPPPEYEPGRQLDLTPKAAPTASPAPPASAAPSAAPAPPPPAPAPPKG
jgi:hypothetical protein